VQAIEHSGLRPDGILEIINRGMIDRADGLEEGRTERIEEFLKSIILRELAKTVLGKEYLASLLLRDGLEYEQPSTDGALEHQRALEFSQTVEMILDLPVALPSLITRGCVFRLVRAVKHSRHFE
jgi:hypothetical protein